MKYRFLAALLALLMVLLCGCGASSVTDAVVNGSQKLEYSESMDMEMESPAEAPGASLSGSGETGSQALPEGRKWIVTVEMSAETEDLTAVLTSLEDTIAELGGYVEDQNLYNGSLYNSSRYRSVSMTIRIPAKDVEKFTQEVTGYANVVRQTQSRDDITLTYVSTESRVTALRTEEERLLELMEKAETMSDLLEIESRLTDVRYELERYASQLRVYDNQVDYATIYLDIEEVQRYTPVAERTVWERITEGFSESVEDLWDGIVDFFVWLIVSSPFLLLWALILTAMVLLVKRLGKNRKPKAKKQPPEQKAE